MNENTSTTAPKVFEIIDGNTLPRLTLGAAAKTGNPMVMKGCRSFRYCSKCNNVPYFFVALKIFFISPCIMIW